MADEVTSRRPLPKKKKIQYGWCASRWIRAIEKQFSRDQSESGERKTRGRIGPLCRQCSTTAPSRRSKLRRPTPSEFMSERSTGEFFGVSMAEKPGAQTCRVRRFLATRLLGSTPRQSLAKTGF